MKSEREIREKIEELKEQANACAWWDDEKEPILNNIDALLWVLGDRSGKAI